MTKEQHIQHWVDTAQYDWEGAEGAFTIKRYLHCLFWAHLTLEKLAKAHWVKTHTDNIPTTWTQCIRFVRKIILLDNWKKPKR